MNKPTRPPLDEFAKNIDGYVACTCLSILKTWDEIQLHWEAGHFDVYPPVPTVEELENKLKIAIEQFEAIQKVNTLEGAYFHASYALEQIKGSF
jgi:hypothetical protein